MGLLSKKEYVCVKCGKTFSRRMKPSELICDDCSMKEFREKKELEAYVGGYNEYASNEMRKTNSLDEMKQILEHRARIMEKYYHNSGISKDELQQASDNYKKLSEEQALDVLDRAVHSLVTKTMGAAYTENFFAPTAYPGLLVDIEDVFAVGYTTSHQVDVGANEALLCVVFTNDPYVPVFPMLYIGKTGFFDFTKSKQGRASAKAWYEAFCPNLKYPVDDIKKLKKQIKQEGVVNGAISQEEMLRQIDRASSGVGIFSAGYLSSVLYGSTTLMLNEMGYMELDELNGILHMDKMFNRNYWNKMLDKLSK